MIALDTDVLIEIFDKKSKKGEETLKKLFELGEDVCITSINLHEILYGLFKYAKPVKEALYLPVLNYGKEDARLSAHFELELEREGKPIRRTDAMIAAVVVNSKARFYTFDTAHFEPLKNEGLELV